MRYHFIFIMLYVFLFYFCDTRNSYDGSKPTEFFRIDSAKSYTGFNEHYVVYNAPKDTLLLLHMIENYNLRTLPISSLKKYDRYLRTFYAKSKFLTRDFKAGARDTTPGSPHTYQELNSFMDDLLITIEFNKWNDETYRYYRRFKYNFEGKQTTIIYNLDSFYNAKRIETADIDTTMIK